MTPKIPPLDTPLSRKQRSISQGGSKKIQITRLKIEWKVSQKFQKREKNIPNIHRKMIPPPPHLQGEIESLED